MRRSVNLMSGCLLAALVGCGGHTGLRTTPAAAAADSSIRAAIARETTLERTEITASTIGVLPLRVASTDRTLEPLGYGLAELLMSDLARSGQVEVVDRLRVHALVRELALVSAGVADSATGPRFGRLLGAGHLVLGELASAEAGRLRIDTRVARSEDGSIRAVTSGTASLDDIIAAEKSLAFQVFNALGVNLTPAERAEIERRPTRSLAALLAFSRGARAEAELRFADSRRQYRDAIRLDRAFRLPRERLAEVEAYFPDPAGVAALSVDAINRPHLPAVSDVTDPAFRNRPQATLVIPIDIP